MLELVIIKFYVLGLLYKIYVFLLVVFFKIVVNVFIMKWIIIIVVGVFVERLKCLEVDVMILVLVKFWY